MILIYSKYDDAFVNQVIDCLENDFIRISDRDEIVIDEIAIDNNRQTFEIHNEFKTHADLGLVSTVWINGGNAKAKGGAYENDCYSILVNSFLKIKSARKFGKLVSDFEISKLDVLIEAQKQGFILPDTLFTGCKDKLKVFHKKHLTQDGIICKRITETLFYENEKGVFDFTYTFEINSTIMKSLPDRFAVSLFQQKIIADFEIRVVYIDGEFFAMSIHTFDMDIDYRTKLKSSSDKIRTIPFKLPDSIKKKITKLFHKLDLNYGSIDFMYSNNIYYFLEINPTGQIGFLNKACNFYIENIMSNFLQNES